MPDLTQLPPWAMVVFVIAFGAVFAIIRSGVLEGLKKPLGERKDAGEIIALTIDSRALDRLTGEVAGLSVAMGETRPFLKQLAEAQMTLAHQTGDLKDELGEVRRAVHSLNTQIEISREVGKARP